MTVGTRVREMREDRGISQSRLARESGLSRTFVREIEQDGVSPSTRSLQRIADALGVPLSALFLEPEGAELHGHAHGDAGLPVAGRPAAGSHDHPGTTLSGDVFLDAYALRYLIAEDFQGRLEVILTDDAAPSGDRSSWHLHPGDGGRAACLVIEGTYEAWVEGQTRLLGAGEWIIFSQHQAHTWRLVGPGPGRALLVLAMYGSTEHVPHDAVAAHPPDIEQRVT